MKIAISADSTASITQKEAKEMGIFILPLNVIVDGKEYHDDISINQDTLKDMMRGGSKITTSTPTIHEIHTYFDNIFAKGYEKVVHLTISSKLSSMYELFVVTCKEKYGDKVTVIDSLIGCSFMGNMVRKAKKLANEGKGVKEIKDEVLTYINKTDVYFIPESLTFLKRGGRVSPVVAAIGNLLQVKPVLKFYDGEIIKFETTRNTKKGFSRIFDMLKKANHDPKEYELHIADFDSTKYIDYVVEEAKKIFPEFNIVRTPIAINVCAHAGPGTIGIGMTKK